jgi:pimeloyl-ACP methyl ester carboxylesterase
VPPSVGERLAQEIPGATLDVIPDGRHFVPEESPEAVAESVARLLARE